MTELTIPIDDSLKQDAEALFRNLGLDMTTAITIFLKQCLSYHGLPFGDHTEKYID